MTRIVSVAMCTYNGEKYLHEQLSSIANQSTLPDELVICDDASTDATINIIRAFALRVPFHVNLHINERRIGYTENFNKVLLLTSGDIIFLCDQDDIWLKRKISGMMEVFDEDHGLLIAAHDCQFCNEDGMLSNATLLGNQRRLRGGVETQIHGCCTVLRRELLEIAIPLPPRECGVYGHDEWLHVVGQFLSARKIVDNVYVYYRRHASNATQFDIYADSSSPFLKCYSYSFSKFRHFIAHPAAHVQILQERSTAVSLLLHRVKSLRDGIEVDKNNYHTDRLERLKAGLECRIKISSYGRHKRLISALKMLLSGSYAPFSGWKSFIVDVLR